MSESWATIVPHSQNSSSLFPASLGPSASIFSKSLPFKSLDVGCKNATDCIFVCLRCLQVLWEAHWLCWALECMCFSSQIRPSETSRIQTHPKLSLYLSAMSPNLLLHAFPVCFFFSELWTVLCGFFLNFLFYCPFNSVKQKGHGLHSLLVFLSDFSQASKAAASHLRLDKMKSHDGHDGTWAHPLPPNSPTPYISFPFSQVPTKPANLSK